MIKLLLKTFIKDNEDISNPNVREKYGIFSGITGIILNICLFVGKLVAGILTVSISITADAFNNLSDASSSVVTLIGFKIANIPSDKEHPFGHGRVEYVTGLIISIAIIIVGIELLKSSVEKIITPSQIEFNILSLIILVIAIFVKIWMFFFNSYLSKRIHSEAMHATAMDSLTDSIATSAVVLGVLVHKFFDLNIDAYIGLLVAIFVLYEGVTATRESLSPLLGKAPDKEFVKEIENIVLRHDHIVGIHDLIIHDYGPGRCIISLHAEIPSTVDILHAHDTVDLIEMELRSKFNCDVTIHMDPLAVDDEKTTEIRNQIMDIVKSIDEKLTIHDFRMVAGQTHTNLIFDVTVPYKFHIADSEISKQIRSKVEELNNNYFTVMRLEKGYI